MMQRNIVNRKVATFKDGSTAEVDVVMMCTGYLHSYPFLRLFIVIMIITIIVIMIIVMIKIMIMIMNIVLKTMFNREDLRMKSRNLLYPAGMYKGMVWTAGNPVVIVVVVVVVVVPDVLLLLMFFFLMLLFFLLLKLLLLLNLSKPFWHVHVQGHGVASR